MGFLTSKAKVWYPALTDKMQLHTLFATMASSIENGLQPRLELQERAIGLKASPATQVTLTTSAQTMPVVVNSANGNFAQGLTVTNGVVTVATPGMYMISGSLGIQPTLGGAATTAALNIFKNSIAIISDEQLSSANFYQAAKGTSVINCVAGDTIKLTGRCATGTIQTAADLALTHLTVVMVQAIPQ